LGKLAGFLGQSGPEETIRLARELDANPVDVLRANYGPSLDEYSNQQIENALDAKTQGEDDPNDEWLKSPRGQEFARLPRQRQWIRRS